MNTLFGKTLSELKEICKELSLPAFTAKQIADWLYKKDIRTIEEMTNISLNNRKKLSELYSYGLTQPISCMESEDGTKKYLYKYGDCDFVEAVMQERRLVILSIHSGYGVSS